MKSVKIDCANIKGWDSFHNEFSRVLGFPDFYGKNMDAWIDCMTSIDTPEDGMTTIHCKKGGFLTVELENVQSFKEQHSEQYMALLEASAFVNWRRIEVGEEPVLMVSFNV